MYFDSHAHYDLKAFDHVRSDLLQKIHDLGVEAVVNCAIDHESNRVMFEKLKDYDWIYYSIGIHPNQVDTDWKFDQEWNLRMTAATMKYDRIVAVGETGLDYYRLTRDAEGNLDEESEIKKKRQKEWFRRQIEMSLFLKLPLILHIRDAHEDAISILKQYEDQFPKQYVGVVHCYNSGLDHARRYMDMGFLLGIGGSVTRVEHEELRDAVRKVPLTSLLLETDAPYVKPAGVSGKRNSSLNLPVIAEEVAKLKQIHVREVEQVTTENAKKLFRL